MIFIFDVPLAYVEHAWRQFFARLVPHIHLTLHGKTLIAPQLSTASIAGAMSEGRSRCKPEWLSSLLYDTA